MPSRARAAAPFLSPCCGGGASAEPPGQWRAEVMRIARMLGSDALDALLGFAVFDAVSGPLRPVGEHAWRVGAFVVANGAICVVNAVRVKQRVEREMRMAMGVAHAHSWFRKHSLSAHEGTPLVQHVTAQPADGMLGSVELNI